ncbi:MAG TPA: methyltransferase [Cellulomonas sp.]
MTGNDHYFTAAPASSDERRTRTVHLAGRDLTVETAGGVFSPDHLDAGTEVLLRHVPDPPATGDLLDLGCGWGPVALSMALRSPGATVWAVDVNERALDLTRRNAALIGAAAGAGAGAGAEAGAGAGAGQDVGGGTGADPVQDAAAGARAGGVRAVHPDGVPDDLRFAAIWSNPPIRVGKEALHAMLRQWLPRLAPGGAAYLVVAKHLGADSLQRWLGEELAAVADVDRAATSRGFRVLRVTAR